MKIEKGLKKMNKILTEDELEIAIVNLHNLNKKIVATNGCFDILHVGHVRYLKKAKSLGDVLIVCVNSDSSVKKIKGETRPINNQYDRCEVLSALRYVDAIYIFDEISPLKTLLKIKPTIYAKGADYNLETLPEAKELLKIGTKIEFIDFVEGK